MQLTSKFNNMKKTLEKLNLDIKYVLSKDDLRTVKGGYVQKDCNYAGFNACVNGSGSACIDDCAKIHNC